MAEQNSNQSQIVAMSLDSLSFDSFERNPHMDIVCVSPVRTVVRREEEIILIRKVRKVEEIDASPACPINSVQMSQVQQEGQPTAWQTTNDEVKAN
ncbi:MULTISPECIES: hypothetical protein [unclassified Coleofasciculus]|uniref:hypothetical protein n=1 Tax=unclassified Coleofasciculus TaxID=2692782 RepID=UPI001882F1E3|nr:MULTISPECIES: hypothetical protein [unclassified Coleofasciculus]MBE9127406.1 hypothetical protein [Coleofasciculus sp. LEGE 07081]MBE9147168.1 hypothetical protein [Coleofasciculus sp. LEGE 07092]